MRKLFLFTAVFICAGCTLLAAAAAKPKIIAFGKSMSVKLFVGPTEDKTVDMKVRPLMVDAKIKEFTTGEPHEVTDRLFVVRRSFRVNNNLPVEEDAPVGQRKQPKWMWQRGGWLLVDRTTARISQINLPDFDPFYSEASWFRDYVAYCGVSDNAEKLFVVVTQLGRKKPILRRELGPATQGELPDADCAAPVWERQPNRVTFQPKKGEPISFTVRGHAADSAPGSDDD